jgi:hypothetical protein
MSTLLNGEGLETASLVGLVLVGGGAAFIVWCAARIGHEVERAEALGLVRRRHFGP